jgi:hypothetical protein
LAARAYIRHHHTDYEIWLIKAEAAGSGILDEDEEDEIGDDHGGDRSWGTLDYREIKRRAHQAVDAFLEAHRSP